MAKFEPFELVHPVFGRCFITNPRDAIFTGSGARAFRVQSAPKRLGREDWRKILLLDSFAADPRILHALHQKLYAMCSDERRRGVK